MPANVLQTQHKYNNFVYVNYIYCIYQYIKYLYIIEYHLIKYIKFFVYVVIIISVQFKPSVMNVQHWLMFFGQKLIIQRYSKAINDSYKSCVSQFLHIAAKKFHTQKIFQLPMWKSMYSGL